MSLSGNIDDVALVDVLQLIGMSGRSGTLLLMADGLVGTISFHRGKIVSAWGPGSKRLGELLVEADVLSVEQLAKALAVQGQECPPRPIGQVLLALGLLDEPRMLEFVERQVEAAVRELVAWRSGTFHFTLDEVRPIEDIAAGPGDTLGPISLSTQAVLLEAARSTDEHARDRDDTSSQRTAKAPSPATSSPAASGATTVQVVTRDPALFEAVQVGMRGSARAVRVELRDAGLPPPGEPAPIVLLDARDGVVDARAIAMLHASRQRAWLVAIADESGLATSAYEAGAVAVVQPEARAIKGCCSVLLASRRMAGAPLAGTADLRAGLAKLHRVFAELRSGFVTATVSLHLMNILSDVAERAVLFLVRRDCLLTLGAFGEGTDGRPLANATRGLKVGREAGGLLFEALADGRARSAAFGDANLPPDLASLLGAPRTGECVVLPVLGCRSAIAVTYADNGGRGVAFTELDLLELATAQVGMAFENELLRRQLAARGATS